MGTIAPGEPVMAWAQPLTCARWMALVALTVAIAGPTGCGDILGFHHSLVIQCVHPSDCPPDLTCLSNICTVPCNADGDCPTGSRCSDHRCRVLGNPGTDVNAPMAADAAAGDASACPQACPPFDVCRDSRCYPYSKLPPQGPAEPAATGIQISPGHHINCVLLPDIGMPTCGYITGVGFTARVLPADTHVRFGIYRGAGGGYPSHLAAQTTQSGVSGLSPSFEVSPPVLVGCSPNAGNSLWICLVTSRDFVLETTSQSQATWASGLHADSDLQTYLVSGMPLDSPTQPSSFPGQEPFIYAYFAQVPAP
ncbi:MAG: hypothetical protein M3O36_04470 [Myxococcota bacterium]|nr:hypothetical protein [Myxococcota bacterium]